MSLWILACHSAHVEVRGQLRELVLLFHCVGSGNGTLVFRLSGNHPYSQSHLVNNYYCFKLLSSWTACTLVIPAFERQRQEKFKVIFTYEASFRPAWAIWAIASKRKSLGTGEVAQELRALLAENPNLVCSTHRVDNNCIYFQFQGIQCPPLSSKGTRAWRTYMYAGKTVIHIK